MKGENITPLLQWSWRRLGKELEFYSLLAVLSSSTTVSVQTTWQPRFLFILVSNAFNLHLNGIRWRLMESGNKATPHCCQWRHEKSELSPLPSNNEEPCPTWVLMMAKWQIGKDPDAGKDWRQKEKRVAEDDLVGWHYRQRTWTWVNFRRWWGTVRPGVLQSMGWQKVRHDLAAEQQVVNPLFYSYVAVKK